MTKKRPIASGVLIPSLESMDRANAEFVLSMRLSPAVIDRVDELSAAVKHRELTEDERAELDFYLDLGSVLTIMHSKARMAMKRPPARAGRRKSA